MSRPAPNPPKSHATPRLKIETPDFAAVRAKSDAALREAVDSVAREWGVSPDTMQVHVSGRGRCYCACPDGPCEHEFAGWRAFDDGLGGEQVCAKCGMGAMSHSLRTGP